MFRGGNFDPLLLAFVALGLATWEIFVRHRARSMPVRLLAAAGGIWLASGMWRLHLRERGEDPSFSILLDLLIAPLLVVPYVLARADEAMRGEP